MKSKIAYLLIIVAILCTGFYLMTLAPYHIYSLSLTEGLNTKFLTLGKSDFNLLDGEEELFGKKIKAHDDGLFELYHFSHFEFPIPTNHSLYYIYPDIKIKEQAPKLGASFSNAKNVRLFNFEIEKPYRFTLSSDDQSLFELPIFNNYIRRKKPDELWKDLFSKKLSLPSNDGKSFFESLEVLKTYSINELVYNLYILYNRKMQIPDDVVKLKFQGERKLGIVELPSDDEKILIEKVYLLYDGFVYPIVITTRKSDFNAMNFRARFLREIQFRESSVDSAVALYARYQNLSYKQRISQVGMGYLYAAWSHDLNNKEYIRFIIQFLERSKDNASYLKPFYDYAFKKFGSSFSSREGSLVEDPKEALKRKGQEQLAQDVKTERDRNDMNRVDEFTSDEEKIFFHLNQAKDRAKDKNKIDKDQTESRSLIME